MESIKRPITIFVLFLFVSIFSTYSVAFEIKGCVKNPMKISLKDLQNFTSIEIQLNEVDRAGRYQGVFLYRGVPLKYILELAKISKKNTDFNKPVDLAIKIKSGKKEVVLSWGEVFFRNPQDVIIAYSKTPVYPHKIDSCKRCHYKTFYQSYLNILERRVSFPRLIVTNDFFTDRSLEGITSIEVIDLKPNIPSKRGKMLFSSNFLITKNNKKLMMINSLASFKHYEYNVKVVGEGRGYHGVNNYKGVSLKNLIKKIKTKTSLNTVFLISAPDGYRSLVSYGEIFLNPFGKRTIIADKRNNIPIKKDGKFILIIPEDLLADRFVKAISRIDIIDL